MNWKDSILRFYEGHKPYTVWVAFTLGYYSGVFVLTILVLLAYVGILKP